ncbi:MAG: hypothetical protein A4E32_00196 [Methanomassiliicoccales archaeon PtaU1.Bin124]|nr:MAG: hypothetical protein A4E32_00196 [Methanomassiliicoccales archaeon PtaU1.Bin124]
MPISYNDELMRSTPETSYWGMGLEFTGGAMMESKGPPVNRTRPVRDYKDKFILKFLQEEARRDNPGFKQFDGSIQDARIMWVKTEGDWEPAGYVIISRERQMPSAYERRLVFYPETLTQLFVRREQRRKGVGKELLREHILGRGHRPVWVESPKWETRAILAQLGYEETEERYEVWQMMEGLTKWVRRWDL